MATAVHAKVFLSQDEALRLAFPPGTNVERRTAFLSDPEKAEVARLSGAAPPPGLVISYLGKDPNSGLELGTAYFDTHIVRTQAETILVLIDPKGALARLEVLSFQEPEEYLPRPTWYAQFPGKKLSEELSPKRGIRPVTGATLTVRATLDAARRVLALHDVLRRRAAAPAPRK